MGRAGKELQPQREQPISADRIYIRSEITKINFAGET